jgi:hypothetical protein
MAIFGRKETRGGATKLNKMGRKVGKSGSRFGRKAGKNAVVPTGIMGPSKMSVGPTMRANEMRKRMRRM